MPIVWAATLINQSRREKWIKDDFALKSLIDVSTLKKLIYINNIIAASCIVSFFIRKSINFEVNAEIYLATIG